MTTKQKKLINRTPQFSLFLEEPTSPVKSDVIPESTETERRFIAPDPADITVGNVLLKHYLEQADQQTPMVIANMLDQQNWSNFEARYARFGRPPYAPRNMVGLILYGIMQGVTSLRALEKLARLDLGCMWVSGGIYPDHTNIGRFINLHEASLTGEFFDAFTRSVLQKTNSTGQRLAGDGTTIEAACSNYNLIKEEAARVALEEARKQSEKKPEDPKRQANLKQATTALNTVLHLKEGREKRGRKTEGTKVSPTEPEAIVQKMKRNRGFAPGYTPSILVNEQRVVVSQAVDPTHETAVIPEMLDQAIRTTGQEPDELLLDGGYCNEAVLSTTIERGISLLCSPGKRPELPAKGKKYQKSHFHYDPTEDAYTCPAQQKLTLLYPPKDPSAPKARWVYGGAPCQDCPLKGHCTKSKIKRRRITRYAMDDLKDSLQEVMSHPSAQKIFKQRKTMVEPVFGYLRMVQGLNRFRRRGLGAVKLEFSLHLLAYNLSRVVATHFNGLLGMIGTSLWAISLIKINGLWRLSGWNSLREGSLLRISAV